jgi:hypothetical protein
MINPPINTEGTCNEDGNLSLWSNWKQTSDCCSGPVKTRIYYQRNCLKSDCQCLGSSQAVRIKKDIICFITNFVKFLFANSVV